MNTTSALPAPSPAEARGRTSRGLILLAAALALGVLGDVLLDVPPGLGIALWIAAVLLGVALLARRLDLPLRGEGRWLFLPALAFAAALAWRASPPLAVLNLFAVLVSLGLAAAWARAGSPRRGTVGEYLTALLSGGFRTAVGPVLIGLGEVEWTEVAHRGRSETTAAVLRGVLISSPLLFLFGALLASADPVFERLLRDLLGGDWEGVLQSVFEVMVFTWLAAGYLRTVLLDPARAEVLPPAGRRRWTVDPLEATVVLALLNALFLAFVLVQFRYLFGGAELVREMVGLSFAEYARRGFFELVAVAALILPVLLGLDALVGRERDRPRALRALSAGMVALLLVIIASAAERMRLYLAAYGLTEQRFFASAFVVWLAIVFVWFAATALRGRPERFAWGALLAGLGVVAALNALDPDARIARVNLQRARETGRLDDSYLRQLSADATPVLLPAIAGLPEPQACGLAAALLGRERRLGEESSWASWNWSRARASALLREREEALERIACERSSPTGASR